MMERLSELVLGNLERFFYWYNYTHILTHCLTLLYFPARWGLKVSRHPLTVITSCIVITGVASLGYLNFR